MDVIEFLFDPANRGIAITVIVIIGLIFWFVLRDPVGRWMDKKGADGGLFSGFFGALATIIVVLVVGFVILNVINARMAWTYVQPIMTKAQAQADAEVAVLNDGGVRTAQVNRAVAKANADTASYNAEAAAYTTGNPVRALAPAMQVAKAEWNKLTDPSSVPSYTTSKVNTYTEFEPVKDPATGSVTLVPTGRPVEEKTTTTRQASPMMLIAIVFGIAAATKAFGGKS